MRRLPSLDLLALLWVYADAVAICNKIREFPSSIYKDGLLHGLSVTSVSKTMETRSLTGDGSLDLVLLKYHKRTWIKQGELNAILYDILSDEDSNSKTSIL